MQSRGAWHGADLKLQAEQVVAPNLWLSAEVNSNRAHSQQGPAHLPPPPGSTFQTFTARVFQIYRKCNLQENVGRDSTYEVFLGTLNGEPACPPWASENPPGTEVTFQVMVVEPSTLPWKCSPVPRESPCSHAIHAVTVELPGPSHLLPCTVPT